MKIHFQGLGQTVSALRVHLKSQPIPKTQFSMVTKEITEWLENQKYIDTILLCGIETHVCILGTAIDLLHLGYHVRNNKNNL